MKLLGTVWVLERYPKDGDRLDKEYKLDGFDPSAWRSFIGDDEESGGDVPVIASYLGFLQKYVPEPIDLDSFHYFVSECGQYEWGRDNQA